MKESLLKRLFEMLDKKEREEIACMVKESSFDYTKAFRKLLKYSSDNNATLDFSYTTPYAITQRKALWEKGYRYRKNCKDLPGRPDIVLTKYRIAIFCDSEFFCAYNRLISQ